MADDIESKRRELDQLYDKLEQLERENPDSDLVREYRARTRQLADEISDMERGDRA